MEAMTPSELKLVIDNALPGLDESLLYHVRGGRPYCRLRDPEPVWPRDYTFAASVYAYDLEMVFDVTSFSLGEVPPWENERVCPLNKHCRSTAVGDVVVLIDGTVNRCESSGWTTLISIRKGQLPPECRLCDCCDLIRHPSSLVRVSDRYVDRLVCGGTCEFDVFGNL